MYQKPRLERFGSFRELTQWGGGGLFLLDSTLPGCKASGNKPKKCQAGGHS